MASPDKKAFLLRLPPDVWGQIERLAAAELRSVNGQIEYMLRDALARRMGTEASRLTSPEGLEPGGTPRSSGKSAEEPGSGGESASGARTKGRRAPESRKR